MIRFFVIIVTIIFSLNASAQQCNPKRDKNGKIARSSAEVTKFKRLNACPKTGLIQKTCPGYVVDHINPLCNCGADSIENMQWQTLKESKQKDKIERKLCNGD